MRRPLTLIAALSLVASATAIAGGSETTVVGREAVATEQAAVPAAASPSASAPAGKSWAMAEVTVIARRLKMESRVTNFVYGIAALENNEGLARWQAPACPLVAGLPREEGEFVLARVSEIARAADVPLAGEQCRPNLFIFVTAHPKELLEAMAKEHRAVTFGAAAPTIVDEFINTPRPVRVWVNSHEMAAGGGPPPSAEVGKFSAFSAPTFSGGGMVASRLVSNVVWTFGAVYVVVDQTRLRGVSRGQFADYVGMVSFAEIKPNAHVGDTQSILSLFNGSPQSAPAGISDWDQAFLKSLYRTDQESKLQRSLISRAMMREFVH